VRVFCDDAAMIQRSRAVTTALVLLTATALLSSCGYGYNDGKLTMDFSALQIQNAIAPKFPVENCPVPLTCIKLQNPKINLPENSDRIELTFDSIVTLLQQPITGSAVVSAKPRYQASTGEVFLDDSRFQDMQLRGVPPNLTNAIMQYGSALAQQTLQRTPIYSFKNAQAEKIAKMGIADVKVVNGKLRVIFDPTLAQAPKTSTP
jgi:Protein of unknown function (DUF1439)